MSTDEPRILAIDLGTSACKVGILTLRGDLVAYVRIADATPTRFLPGGGAEQDPADWWRVITQGVHQVLDQAGQAQERIGAISVCAHWSGTVPVDRDGQPLGSAIIWMDTRGAPYVRQITGGPVRIQGYGVDKLLTWIRLTGGIPTHSGKDPIAHILYLKHREPERYQAAWKLLEPKDYLNLRLTGQAASDYATITLHWLTDNRDIHRVHYAPVLLRWAGIDPDKLPDLYPPNHVLGPLHPQAAADLDLPAGIPVVMGAPDVHAPALGSGAVADFEPHIYLGTSSWLSCHVPFKKTDLFHNMASLPSSVPGRYFVANEQETSGVSLTFLRDAFFYAQDELGTGPAPEDAYARFDRLAAHAPPGARGLIFTPWLYGERTPVDDPTLRGGLYNLSLGVQRADVVRAVFEGVALNTRWLLVYVEKFVKRRFQAIRMIGGGALSDVWCQIFADVLARPIQQVRAPQAAGLRGAALLAGLALGMTSLVDIEHHVAVERVYTPDPALAPLYDERFVFFREIYRRNAPFYRRLNRIEA